LWIGRGPQQDERKEATSKAVAMLSKVVDAQWGSADEAPQLGAPLDPAYFGSNRVWLRWSFTAVRGW